MKGEVVRERLLRRKRDGFTLTELLAVVIILGILAAIAIPTYTRTVEKVKGEKAVTNLRLIRTGERMYRLDHNAYTNLLSGLYPTYIDNPNPDPDWTYGNPVLDAAGFDATATRSGGSYPGGTINIDQGGTITTGGGWPFNY